MSGWPDALEPHVWDVGLDYISLRFDAERQWWPVWIGVWLVATPIVAIPLFIAWWSLVGWAKVEEMASLMLWITLMVAGATSGLGTLLLVARQPPTVELALGQTYIEVCLRRGSDESITQFHWSELERIALVDGVLAIVPEQGRALRVPLGSVSPTIGRALASWLASQLQEHRRGTSADVPDALRHLVRGAGKVRAKE